MELKIYSIRDSKGEIYKSPFYKTTHGEAERDFHTIVNNKDTLVAQYPEDFDLYHIGTFDDNNGKIRSLDTPEHIIKAVNCVKKSDLKMV